MPKNTPKYFALDRLPAQWTCWWSREVRRRNEILYEYCWIDEFQI